MFIRHSEGITHLNYIRRDDYQKHFKVLATFKQDSVSDKNHEYVAIMQGRRLPVFAIMGNPEMT